MPPGELPGCAASPICGATCADARPLSPGSHALATQVRACGTQQRAQAASRSRNDQDVAAARARWAEGADSADTEAEDARAEDDELDEDEDDENPDDTTTLCPRVDIILKQGTRHKGNPVIHNSLGMGVVTMLSKGTLHGP